MAGSSIAGHVWSFVGSRLWQPYKGNSVKPPRSFEGRQQWSNKLDFLMACTGYAVGLGNVWRFPYLCYKNGGGAFLIPYFFVALTSGVPLFFLEIALGQFTGQGCVTCWKLCPLFKGIGYGIVVLCSWLNVYYIVVLAWALYYFYMSFQSELPWSHCGNDWNTVNCTVAKSCDNTSTNMNATVTTVPPVPMITADEGIKLESYYLITNHTTAMMIDNGTCQASAGGVDPAEEFWKLRILQMTDGIDDLGGMNWGMLAALGIAWVINYFIIWKGVKISGKIVYFTAVFPYLMLTALLIRGVTLDGAELGIEFYLKPNFSKILEPGVWLDAGTQIFFAYAVSTGALIAMGSYNRFNNNCYKDTWLVCVINSVTGIVAGICIFSVLGFMAKQQGVPVDKVVADGPGLAFVAYPKALAQMPGYKPVWSALFFFMLMLLGVDSEFVGLEGLFTTLLDMKPALRHGYRPEIIMALTCLCSYIFGFLICTNGGIYIFQLLDYYSASGFVLLWFCFFECIAIAWVYGAQRFYADISTMLGYRISPWMLICWAFVAPVTSASIFLVSLLQHTPIELDDYLYPAWADGIGWCIALSSMVCIPFYIVYRLCVTPGRTLAERLHNSIQPEYAELPSAVSLKNVIVNSDPHRPVENGEAPVEV